VRDRPGSTTRARVHVLDDGRSVVRRDSIATEEPLEIRVAAGSGGPTRTVAVTMRTPGADFELAAGFLYSEGVLDGRDALRQIAYCTDPTLDAEQRYNVVTAELAAAELPDLAALDRHFTTTSACGVCGKASLDALRLRGVEPIDDTGPGLNVETLYRLPEALRAAQDVFSSTGGLHAAGLFDADGGLVCLREDVGRHNAVDKVVGWSLLSGRVPLAGHVLMVSGRTSYEIVQKALVARVPVVCAVSAPSSLAVALAEEFNVTLVGFLRDRRCNVYSGAHRLALAAMS
jgi:FdhD protein